MSTPDTLSAQVLEDIKAGKTYRQICKERHVSPKTIKSIREGKPSQQDSEGDVAAQAFDRFSKNEKPTAVVINLKQPPELIQRLFAKYSEMEGSVVLTKPEKDEIALLLNSVRYQFSDVESLKSSIRALVAELKEWNKFTTRCSTCNKPVRLIDTADGLEYLFSGPLKWQHKGECFEKRPSAQVRT